MDYVTRNKKTETRHISNNVTVYISEYPKLQ